jgi:hypothetical protein
VKNLPEEKTDLIPAGRDEAAKQAKEFFLAFFAPA